MPHEAPDSDVAVVAAYAVVQGCATWPAQPNRPSALPDLWVELRARPAVEAWFMGGDGPADLRRTWEAERRRWKVVHVLPLIDVEPEAAL